MSFAKHVTSLFSPTYQSLWKDFFQNTYYRICFDLLFGTFLDPSLWFRHLNIKAGYTYGTLPSLKPVITTFTTTGTTRSHNENS